MNEDIVFDEWCIQKKNIQKTSTPRFYREREIWWVSLGKNIGSEQDGKGAFYDRPVLVIKAFSKSVCLIIPLTTSIKNNPYHINIGIIDNKKASVIISQIRLIDTKRLLNRITILDKTFFSKIRKTIKKLF